MQLSKTKRDILIGITICIVMVFVMEILAKFSISALYGSNPQKVLNLGHIKYGFNPYGYGDLHPNQDGVWVLQKHTPYHVQTNSVGLRNSEELNEDDSLRILAIGDSFTFGVYLPNEQTWPGITEQLLRNKLSDPYIQVLNAGIPGYTIEDYMDYYQDKGIFLNADIIILESLYNDIADLHPQHRINREKDKNAAIDQNPGVGVVKKIQLSTRKWLGDYSSIYLLMHLIKKNKLNPPRESEDNVSLEFSVNDIVYFNPNSPQNSVYWNQYESLLIEFIDLVNKSGSKLIIVGFPDYRQMPIGGYPDSNLRLVEEIAKHKQIPFLNLLQIFRDSGNIENLYLRYVNSNIPIGEDPFFPEVTNYEGDSHLSRYGNQIASDAIVTFLETNKIILKAK